MKNTVNNMPVNPNSGGGGSRGGWMSHLFGMLRSVKMEELNRSRYAWQQTFLTGQMKERDINRASAQAAGKVVGEDMRQKNNAKNAFAFERKRTSRNKKTGELNYPALNAIGPAEDPLNARWSSRSGIAYAEALAAARVNKEEQAKTSGEEKPKFTETTPTVNATNFSPIKLSDEPQQDMPGSPTPSTTDLNQSKPSATTPKARKPRAPKPPKAGA